jgi:hypothetical protein
MRILLLTAAIGSALISAFPAGASATATRAEYATQVNAICSQGAAQTKRASKKPAKGKTLGAKQISRLLARVTRIYTLTVNRVAQVPPAPGDEALVAGWVASLQQLGRLTKKAAALLGRLFVLAERVEADEDLDKADLRKLIDVFTQAERLTRQIERAGDRSYPQGRSLGANACIRFSGAGATNITG